MWIFGRAPHVKQELVKSKSSLYAQMDKTWKVEIALAEALAADAGDVCMTDHIIK